MQFGPIPGAIVARYADVSAALRDHEHFSNVHSTSLPEPAYKGPFYPERDLLGQDPPVQKTAPRLISRDFTPKRIRGGGGGGGRSRVQSWIGLWKRASST